MRPEVVHLQRVPVRGDPQLGPVTLRGENIAQDFVALIDDYVERTYVRTIG